MKIDAVLDTLRAHAIPVNFDNGYALVIDDEQELVEAGYYTTAEGFVYAMRSPHLTFLGMRVYVDHALIAAAQAPHTDLIGSPGHWLLWPYRERDGWQRVETKQ